MKSIIYFISNIFSYIVDGFMEWNYDRKYKEFAKRSKTCNSNELRMLRDEWLLYVRKQRRKSQK